MSRVFIIYDGKDPFWPQPTPFIGVDVKPVYYGELWAKKESLSFDGQLTGCTFGDIFDAQRQITENFKKDYQTLEIWQEENGVSGRVFQKDLCQIESINFPQDKWIGVLPYNITVSCYPSGYFSGAYGVSEPADSWNLQEAQNYTLGATHTISCKGLNTSNGFNNALDNAKNWALAKRGMGSFVNPAFIRNVLTGSFCLLESKEEINRFNGAYSITDTYSSDLTRSGYGVLRYSTSFESGNGVISVGLQGAIDGCGQNIQGLRQIFSGFDKAATAAVSYQKIFNKTDLNPIPLNYSAEEDVQGNKIAFNYSFNNDNSPEIYYDYAVGLSSGDSIEANIGGNIVVRGGTVEQKLVKAKNFAKTLNLYNLVTPFYTEFYPNGITYPLNTKPISSGIAVSEYKGEVSLNATFNNSDSAPDGLDSFNYSLNFVPSNYKLDSRPRLNGNGIFSTVDMNLYTRASLEINGAALISNGVASDAGERAIREKCQSLFAEYGRNTKAAIERNEVQFSRQDKRSVTFNFAWSFDSNGTVITPPNYSSIASLGV